LTELKLPESTSSTSPGKATTEYKEQPYITEINLKTGKINPLLALPEYQESKLSVAPDGLGILFDQILTTNASTANAIPSNNSETIIKSRLWLLLPPSQESTTHQVEQLPLIGFHPQWLP
jgi:hypothetical protein